MSMDAQSLGEIQVGTAVAYLTMKDMGFFDEIKKATSAMQGFQDSSQNQVSTLEKFSSVTSNWGSSLTRSVTTPLVNLGKSSINTYKDMESAFTGVKKTIDETRFQEAFGNSIDGWEKLDDAIKEIAQSTNSTYEEVAGVMEWAGQLNVPLGEGGETIKKFTKTMVELGDSTNLSASQSAESLAKFLNIVEGGSIEAFNDIDKLGSVIVDLGNNSATTESDIVSMAMRLAAAGNQIGLSETEILGFATALSSVGITAEMGGSAFSKAMVKMQVAAETGYEPIIALQEQTGKTLREIELMSTNDSKGFIALADSLGMTTTELKAAIKAGNNLNDFAEVANMTTEDFVKLYREDATAALQAFITGLGDTESHGESAITMLQEMGFTEVRLRDVLLRLASSSDLVGESVDRANVAWGENSALSEEAEKRYATLEAQLNQLNERWKEMKYDIAELLIPVLSRLMDIAEAIIKGWKGLSDGTKEFIVHALELAAVLGPILSIIGKLSGSLVNIGKLFGGIKSLGVVDNCHQLGDCMEGTAGKVEKVGGMFSKLGGIIGTVIKVVSGIAAVIAGAVLAVKSFFDMWENGWNVLSTILEAIGLALAAIGAVILGAPAAVAAAVAGIVFALSQLAIVIHDNWDAIVSWLKERWDNFVESWNETIENIKIVFHAVVEWIKERVSNTVEGIKELWNTFTEWWQGLGESIKEIWSKVWDTIFGFVYDVIDKIHTAINKWFLETFGEDGYITGIPAIIHDLITGVLTFIKSTIELIGNLFKDLFNILVDLFTGNFEKLKEDLAALWSHIKSWFNDNLEMVQAFCSDIWEVVKGFFSNIWDTMKEWFDNFTNGVREFFSNLGNTLSELFDRLKETLSNLFNTLMEVVNNLIDTIKQGIENFVNLVKELVESAKELISNIVETIQGIVQTIIDTIKDLINSAIEVLQELWTTITTVFKETFEKVRDFVKEKITDLIDWFKGLVDKFKDMGKSIIDGLWEGMKSVWDNVSSWFEDKFGWIQDLVNKIKNTVGGITDKISNLLPGHASGLDYVPYDNYVARLHEGERVLTKQEARDYNNGNHGTGGDTFNFYNTKPDPYEYARQMKRVKKEIQFG